MCLFHWLLFVGVIVITIVNIVGKIHTGDVEQGGEAENIKLCLSYQQPGDPGQTGNVCLNKILA